MNAEPHVVPPFAADLVRRHGSAHEHAGADATPFLGQQLGGKCPERESHHRVCGGMMQCRAARDVFDRIVADAASVRYAVVWSQEDLAGIHVGGVHGVSGRAQSIDEGTQPFGEALCVMEQQDVGHVSSVRLYVPSREQKDAVFTRSPHRYADSMPHRAHLDRSLALGWFLVAVQAVLFVAVAFWPSSWGPAAPPAREVGSVLFLVGGVGIALSAFFLGRALTPVPQPNGTGLKARGLYRWVRHPMYTSVVVVCVGIAAYRGSAVVWVVAMVLAAFFEVKTRLEERFLVEEYDGYASYAARTGKFVPGVGRRR